jgi:hypothetical protein
MGVIFDYFVGLDLGQSRDYSALCVVEEPSFLDVDRAFELNVQGSGWVAPSDLNPHQAARLRGRPSMLPNKPVLSVRHLERFELGTKYPAIVSRVVDLMNSQPLKGRTALIVDASGVGAPVCDLLSEAGLRLAAVTITGGSSVTNDGRRYSVPKRDLVFGTVALLQSGRLKIASALPDAATLTRELTAYRIKYSETGHDSYSNDPRENPHDDLVLALALACWYRQFVSVHYDAAVRLN